MKGRWKFYMLYGVIGECTNFMRISKKKKSYSIFFPNSCCKTKFLTIMNSYYFKISFDVALALR